MAAATLLAFDAQAQVHVPFSELLYAGQVSSFYGTPRTNRQADLLANLQRARFAERLAELAQGTLRLRSNLSVGFDSCGAANAFFDPKYNRVTVCLEMMELIALQARDDQAYARTLDRDTFGKLIEGAVWGLYFHELGHAVIAINRLAITGREEDVADQFALYFAVNFVEPQGHPVVLPIIWLFKTMAAKQDLANVQAEALQRILADEHSLDRQRTYNLACWAVGADAARGAPAASFVELPAARANRCASEYARLHDGIRAGFQKYLKVRIPVRP